MGLLQLPLELQERITTKFEWRSFCRIQQTCKYMENLIRTSRNVRIHLPADLTIDTDWIGKPKYSMEHAGDRFAPNFESLYGVKCNGIFISSGFSYSKNSEFHILKRCRITTKFLDVAYNKFSDEHLEELLSILKPVKFEACMGRPKLKVLLNANQLTDVKIFLYEEDIQDQIIIKKTLEKFRQLDLTLSLDGEKLNYDVTKVILQYLRSEPLPKLRYLYFQAPNNQFRGTVASSEELIESFRDFNTNYLGKTDRYWFDLQLGPIDRFCKLKLSSSSIEIVFNKRAENEEQYQ